MKIDYVVSHILNFGTMRVRGKLYASAALPRLDTEAWHPSDRSLGGPLDPIAKKKFVSVGNLTPAIQSVIV
jgi:hypothetical protein